MITRWIRHGVCIKFCAILEKSKTKTLAMITQAFEKVSMSRTRKFKIYRDRKKTRQVKRRVNILLTIFINIKRIVQK
jgi:hypothetical protein